MLTFAQELRHVAPTVDTDGAEIRVVAWEVARPAFIEVMNNVGGWTYRAWASKNLTGSIDEQVDQFTAQSITDECACWIRMQNSVPTLVRVFKRWSIPEVQVIFGTATQIDYANITDHRALWDIGVRKIVVFADSGWTHYFTHIQERGYTVDAEQPATAPGVVRMSKQLLERP